MAKFPLYESLQFFEIRIQPAIDVLGGDDIALARGVGLGAGHAIGIPGTQDLAPEVVADFARHVLVWVGRIVCPGLVVLHDPDRQQAGHGSRTRRRQGAIDAHGRTQVHSPTGVWPEEHDLADLSDDPRIGQSNEGMRCRLDAAGVGSICHAVRTDDVRAVGAPHHVDPAVGLAVEITRDGRCRGEELRRQTIE